MEKKTFAEQENLCLFRFAEAGSCFHVCSQENHPVLFHNDDDFKAAMNVVALAAFLFLDIRILTFEIMSNHFHFLLSGSKERINPFLKTLVSKISTHPALSDSSQNLQNLSFSIYPTDDLNNLRNVIAYINRNGTVVNPDESVYTYKWGANRYFFNDEAKLRYETCGTYLKFRDKRCLFHSDCLAKTDGIIVLDGYVSPLCYCRIPEAEGMFRSNRQYFYCISRNIESSMEIAKRIGERIFYCDDDLFVLIKSRCSNNYGCKSVTFLPKTAKLELAKELHFDYNAGNKQISRLLKMDLAIVASLFPE